ncbi:hemerythrin domain-containing protein [Anaeromyxobacter dehalogenans]|uniref:Hemerythrin HHE cation binding protein n=1 Tax=Anaeromyxobacter dehalogenans (strain 2CP-C) TaxID=290397 RepID=Q2IJV7_ANADE|nr:hemerythrin domain-containing protein [Anaeromyxobacter dehalogenans]ABC81937.1 Hemerythrin HHE cation binding protein [Anaeromyxobacter dehalogenans 2CP-C]
MLNVIGKRAAPADAVDLLLECHDRIRQFLALGRRVAEARPDQLAEVPEAATRVRRYFTQALPLHAQDEEESILPRLRGREAAVDAALASMAHEHAEHEEPLGRLVAACETVARDPSRHAALAGGMGAAVGELERHFEIHLRREEEIIFPAMRRLLAGAIDAEIVREIRARRGVAEASGQTTP